MKTLGASGATLEDIGWEVCVVTDEGDRARPTLPHLEHGSVFAGYWITVAGGHTRAHRGLQALFVPRSFT